MTAISGSSPRLLARVNGREKIQLSCNLCKRRKLGQAPTCNFPTSQLPRTRNVASTVSVSQGVLQERIGHLETLVRSLVDKQRDQGAIPAATDRLSSAANFASADTEDDLAFDFGHINLQRYESSYVESDHWISILDEISDLKDLVEREPDMAGDQHGTQPERQFGTDLFLLQTPATSKTELLAAMPPRIIVDSIVAKYFKSADMPVTLIIHRGVFMKQYMKFWDDPLATPILWIAILFGMMFIVSYCALLVDEGQDSSDEEALVEYRKIVTDSRERLIQCLRLGNYLKGSPHTIEALLFFLQLEYLQGEDTQQGCWHLIGVIIRIALKMGYHRDGSHFPGMSIFDQEMRRRTWYILTQFDTAAASQVGLPRLIKETQCDTAEPSNLLDGDFDDTASILCARPPSEHTLSQFLVYKSRVVSVYGLISDFTTSSRQKDYNEVIRLSTQLNDAYAQKPPILEPKPMHLSMIDGADLMTRRLYIAMTYHHARITLHRKFMIQAKVNIKYAISHSVCTEATLSVLQLQGELFEQCQPGHMLYSDRWKILSLIQSEFLLATTVLCYNLNDDIVNSRWQHSPLVTESLHQKSVAALHASEQIWTQQQELSKEARTAVKAISFVLNRARRSNQSSQKVDTRKVFKPKPGPACTVDFARTHNEDLPPSFLIPSIISSAKQSLSTPDFAPPSPIDNRQATIQSDMFHTDGSDASFDFLLDMDWSWDNWVQFE